LLNKGFADFYYEITHYSLRILHDSNLTPVIKSSDYKEHLEKIDEWPLPNDCLLSKWWMGEETNKPWLIPDPNHPTAEHEWWTPARFFALQHKEKNPDYVIDKLCPLVRFDLAQNEIYARGKKNEPPENASIKKALGNIPELKKKINPR
jgi:hypothetical protein